MCYTRCFLESCVSTVSRLNGRNLIGSINWLEVGRRGLGLFVDEGDLIVYTQC